MTLKAKRRLAKLTQVNAAEQLEINRATIAMWETGKSIPNARLLPKIAALYNCTIDELFDKPEPEPSKTEGSDRT